MMVTRVAAMATATIWVMAMSTRLAGNKEEKGKGTRANVTAMRVVGIEKGKGSKAMTIVT